MKFKKLSNAKSGFLFVPLGALLLMGMIWPIMRALPLSLMTWDHQGSSFSLPLTLGPYAEFFSAYRGGVIARSFGLAVISTVIVALVGLPLGVAVRTLFGRTGLLSWIELLLVLPFLFSSALRLHSLKLLLRVDGPVATIIHIFPFSPKDLNWLLYSPASVVIGLCFSYAALMLLPAFQMLKTVEENFVWAAKDLGIGGWKFLFLMLRLVRPGIFAGFVLMLVACWFSSLEYEILGRQSSVLKMLEQLVGVEKYSQAFAFALIPFLFTGAFLIFLLTWCSPERLLGLEGDLDEG